ncbi:MAG: transglutaminase family protein [Parachlamydiaceae bacterium]
MKWFLQLILLFTLLSASLPASNLHVLFNSLDPNSIPQHLAFYELYPESGEGEQALQHAWQLISQKNKHFQTEVPQLSPSFIQGLIDLISKGYEGKMNILDHSQLQLIADIASTLPNRKLAGYQARSEDEVRRLPPEEIDLARGLFLAQLAENPSLTWEEILSYEAMIDLMALQILTRISIQSPPEVKIREMNRFIFEEMGFRFPPHSLYVKDIDLYTFLPSVLDSRKGVCLGVSVLYICLAQRLNLHLEMITPPGHIYVRYRENDKIINIETTARGIHIDCEDYLGMDTPYLQLRNIKEVIGLTYFNEASVHLNRQDYAKALSRYKKASLYIPDDLLLKELTAFSLLFLGDIEEGTRILQETSTNPESLYFGHKVLVEDYLNKKIDVNGIKAIFISVDENRESIIAKKEEIENILATWPSFSSGYFHLAITWLQLHRYGEALKALEQFHSRVPHDSKAEYYLTVLHTLRLNYPQAKEHLQCLEKALHKIGRTPKALVDLKKDLYLKSP